jgi:hypothetical protein
MIRQREIYSQLGILLPPAYGNWQKLFDYIKTKKDVVIFLD